jgi:hypothetical protein
VSAGNSDHDWQPSATATTTGDFRIAADNAEFGPLNRQWGVTLIDARTQRLPRIIGYGNARLVADEHRRERRCHPLRPNASRRDRSDRCDVVESAQRDLWRRRARQLSAVAWRIEDMAIDELTGAVNGAGVKIDLTRTELRLLIALARQGIRQGPRCDCTVHQLAMCHVHRTTVGALQ